MNSDSAVNQWAVVHIQLFLHPKPYPEGDRTMNRYAYVLTLGVILLALVVPAGLLINAQHRITAESGDYRLSGPYTHRNLAIFLVHGKNSMKGKSFLTLQEALVQKKVVVYETQSVNELSIQNFSNEDVYVQSGDIV